MKGFYRGLFFVIVVSHPWATASGGTISFSGSGNSGTITPGNLPWVLSSNSSLRNVPVWGVPGLGRSSVDWPPGNGLATSLTVTFTGLPLGVSIDQTPDPAPTLLDDFTRLEAGCNPCTIWTPSYIAGNTVTFSAPIGGPVIPSENLFVNVAFTGGAVPSVTFTGAWTTAVPEPTSLSLTVPALLGAAVYALYALKGQGFERGGSGVPWRG